MIPAGAVCFRSNCIRVRVLMLAWEYPPRIVGGIARHVQELSEALAAQGVEVHVITATHPDAPDEVVENGVYLHRVGVAPSAHGDFLQGVYGMNAAFEARADALLQEWLHGKPARALREATFIHAHDWLVLPAAKVLKHRYKLPLVATIHATEYGRHGGIHSDLSRAINHLEWELSYEAWRVVVCSEFMRGEVQHALNVPFDKIDVIPNGIRAEKFQFEFPEAARAVFRARFAEPSQPLIFFVGRLVREKGVQVLLQALPMVRAEIPDAKLVIVGGGYRAHLEEFVRFCHLERAVQFTGFIPDADLLRLYRVVDVAVYPSLYEPFGIVALEAMAAGTPVVVSDAGGLKEVVRHEETGILTWAGNPESLAWGILRVLHDPAAARRRALNALKTVQRVFCWQRIARQTQQVYTRVWREYRRVAW
ncbi:MAG: glycosyltransferase family 4 protein [Fimbriimonadales bacterium]|nr:glycosyltransferase family 4 protein [Fimbriimonadales bacterium]